MTKRLIFILSVLSYSCFAQKLKSDLVGFYVMLYPPSPVSANYGAYSVKIELSKMNPPQLSTSDIERLKVRFFVFDSLKSVTGNGDLNIDFFLNTANPLKTIDLAKKITRYDFLSNYIIRNKNGAILKEAKVTYITQSSQYDVFGQPDPSDNPQSNIDRQFISIANTLKEEYDFTLAKTAISLYHIKDEKYVRQNTLNDSLDTFLKWRKIKPPFSEEKSVFQNAINFNKQLLLSADKTSEEQKNLVFSCTANLLNFYLLTGDYTQAADYYNQVVKLDEGYFKSAKAASLYNLIIPNKEAYDKKIQLLKENPNANTVSEIKTANAISNEQNYKKGFFIPENAKDTNCCLFVKNLTLQQRDISIIKSQQHAITNYQAEQLNYLFVGDVLYKSLKPQKSKDILLAGPEEMAWHKRNSFAAVLYESDSLFFGIIEKNNQTRYYLIHKSNDLREECPVPGPRQIVFDKTIKNLFTRCFTKNEALKQFLDTYDLKDKTIVEFLNVLKKCEELYGVGKEGFELSMKHHTNIKNACK